jgi:hypothetical protein
MHHDKRERFSPKAQLCRRSDAGLNVVRLYCI